MLSFTYVSRNKESYNLYSYHARYFSERKNNKRKSQNIIHVDIFDLIFNLVRSIFQIFFLVIYFFLSLTSLFIITALPDLINILTHKCNDENQLFDDTIQHNFEPFFTFKSFEKVGNTIPLSLSPSFPS